jgi:hypothetical protein
MRQSKPLTRETLRIFKIKVGEGYSCRSAFRLAYGTYSDVKFRQFRDQFKEVKNIAKLRQLGYYEKHFPWVVQSKKTGYLWLMKRPYRMSVKPEYKVLFVWGKDDRFRVVKRISISQFGKRFKFIGRLR